MPIHIPSHKNPEKQVFGLVGQSLYSDDGIGYKKAESDMLNVGWGLVITNTPTPSPTPTPTVTPLPTATPTPIPSPTPTITPTPTATSTPAASPTPVPTATPTPTPTSTGAPPPTITPTPTPTFPGYTSTPTPTPTTTAPTPTPTVTPGGPTFTPTPSPTTPPPTYTIQCINGAGGLWSCFEGYCDGLPHSGIPAGVYTLAANPVSGYIFAGWTGPGITNSGSTFTGVTVTGNATYQSAFTLLPTATPTPTATETPTPTPTPTDTATPTPTPSPTATPICYNVRIGYNSSGNASWTAFSCDGLTNLSYTGTGTPYAEIGVFCFLGGFNISAGRFTNLTDCNSSPNPLPAVPYYVDGQYSDYGVLSFYYNDSSNNPQYYSSSGPESGLVSAVVCATSITSVTDGTAYLSSFTC